ncbi:hypothetical protein BS47DRAFT_1393720 [Hydnum rufescens UP504]|uniref:Ubiquitin-like protease family profile domain-containing protein n=1 Tax=Hydnum rufescens UP504 TaxID=1448309 RepID=A0A9P6DVS3_9AGAM|nr:hypothetical protein BS47DRAFT_1393720 [Hydnum rufescens UP504]
MEHFIIPTFIQNNHWAVNCIDFRRKTVTYFNSMHTTAVKETVFSVTHKYLKNLAAVENHITFDLDHWLFDGSPQNAHIAKIPIPE